MSIIDYLNKNPIIKTDLGDFKYIKKLGEGGNSFVYLFEKENLKFAIKFLKSTEINKLNRFKDEFFCSVQIQSNKNIARSYHFDFVEINNEQYYIIIMKHYNETLSTIGTINEENLSEKSSSAWKLFNDLGLALKHLHDNNIVHRDIKPQNIFYDEENDCYVIGDLGIAHFSNDNFPKNSKTKIGERLANFDFCAPEQSQKNYIPHPSCDIYSLGQVLQWYITGQTIRGLGRTPFVFTNLSKYLLYLDKIIQKCLLNNPKDRYQKIADIFEDIKTWDSSTKTKNYWEIICSFENAIVKSFPRIIKTLETVNKSEIETFLSNFHEICKLDDFWYMDTDEGDNSYSPIFIDQSGIMVFCNDYEIEIEKLIIHHNEAIPYTNFFILMTKKLQPFNMVDNTGNKINRKASMRWKCDHAILHDGQYISPSETRNGYYEKSKNEIIAVNSNDFLDRYRSLRKFAYIIVPAGTATAIMIDRSPTGRLLQDICKKSKMTSTALKSYLNNIRGHHSHDITKYL